MGEGEMTDESDRTEDAAQAPEPVSSMPKFCEYAMKWIEARKLDLHPGSVADYSGQIRNHLVPRWGDYRLDEIKTLEIRAWVSELRQAGALSNGTIRNIYGLLRNILSEAQADEIISSNAACLRARHLPPNERIEERTFGERHIFTKEELLRIINHDSIPIRWRALYTMLFCTGVRIGEALALTWDDVKMVDAAVPVIKVTKSYNSKVDYLGPTKTNASKTVPIHPRLEDELTLWWGEYRRVVGVEPMGEALVFPAVRGGARKYMRSSVVYHRFQDQLTDLGMSKRRVHDARRAFISTCANTEGVDKDTIKKITHPSPGEVFDGYRETPASVLMRELGKVDFNGGEE